MTKIEKAQYVPTKEQVEAAKARREQQQKEKAARKNKAGGKTVRSKNGTYKSVTVTPGQVEAKQKQRIEQKLKEQQHYGGRTIFDKKTGKYVSQSADEVKNIAENKQFQKKSGTLLGKLGKFAKKAGKFGPAIGSLFGIFPQCGFSVAATNLYAARIITLGTLIAVYLSTSDEMLPILISRAVPINIILTILAIKFAIGMVYGFLIDLIINIKNKNKEVENKIVDICEEEHCHCEKGIFISALKHTINIFIYIFILTFIINFIIEIVGEDTLKSFMQGASIFEPIVASFIGLIPNCASSVIITELYLSGIITFGSLIAGLLVNAGTGILMLFRINKDVKENVKIVAILFTLGAVTGIVMNIFNITI